MTGKLRLERKACERQSCALPGRCTLASGRMPRGHVGSRPDAPQAPRQPASPPRGSRTMRIVLSGRRLPMAGN